MRENSQSALKEPSINRKKGRKTGEKTLKIFLPSYALRVYIFRTHDHHHHHNLLHRSRKRRKTNLIIACMHLGLEFALKSGSKTEKMFASSSFAFHEYSISCTKWVFGTFRPKTKTTYLGKKKVSPANMQMQYKKCQIQMKFTMTYICKRKLHALILKEKSKTEKTFASIFIPVEFRT